MERMPNEIRVVPVMLATFSFVVKTSILGL